jgi:hypothetical protein
MNPDGPERIPGKVPPSQLLPCGLARVSLFTKDRSRVISAQTEVAVTNGPASDLLALRTVHTFVYRRQRDATPSKGGGT